MMSLKVVVDCPWIGAILFLIMHVIQAMLRGKRARRPLYFFSLSTKTRRHSNMSITWKAELIRNDYNMTIKIERKEKKKAKKTPSKHARR